MANRGPMLMVGFPHFFLVHGRGVAFLFIVTDASVGSAEVGLARSVRSHTCFPNSAHRCLFCGSGYARFELPQLFCGGLSP